MCGEINTGRSVWNIDHEQQTEPCETEVDEISVGECISVKERSVTVPVTINIPPEYAHHALSRHQYRKASGDDVELRDLILDQIEFEPDYRIDGDPIDDWIRNQHQD